MANIAEPAQLETYTLLRAALSLFKKSPADLAEDELKQAKLQALNELSIENKVLNSPEAASVIITEQEVQRAFQEIRGRYKDDDCMDAGGRAMHGAIAEDAFFSDLEKNQLNKDSLTAALQRECKVNAVLELIASRAPSISDVDCAIYYHLHAEQFNLPERREVCHIFISINPDYPENTDEMALMRAEGIAEKLHKKPHKFAGLALRHSECPTALQGGVLGTVSRGTLYPKLDAELFRLKPGQVSGVVQSEIGFHILLCKSIHKAETLSLAKATPKIRQLMTERARRTCQRAWLASLPNLESGESRS